jgi:hypothetical protein
VIIFVFESFVYGVALATIPNHYDCFGSDSDPGNATLNSNQVPCDVDKLDTYEILFIINVRQKTG